MIVRYYPPFWETFRVCQLESTFFPIKKRFFENCSKKAVETDPFFGTFWALVGKNPKGDSNYLGKRQLFYYMTFTFKIFHKVATFEQNLPMCSAAHGGVGSKKGLLMK